MVTRFKQWLYSKRLFGAVKQTDNTNPGKYKYSGYGIGFHSRSFSPLPDNTMGRNVIIFWADMNSSVHIDNKGKDILILGKGITQGLEHTLSGEKLYSINFAQSNRTFYTTMEQIVIYLLIVQKLLNLKQKILK